jgi:hypothetical protein
MAYNRFTAQDIRNLGFSLRESAVPLLAYPPVAASQTLRETLADGLPLATAIGSEKAKSEMVVAPMLMEVRRVLDKKVSLFSGIELNVDKKSGLTGFCDFLISLSPLQITPEAPLLVAIEAKDDSINDGLYQCMAEMIAAARFNQHNQKPLPRIYGCVTNADRWLFIRLEGQQFTLDTQPCPLYPIENLLGQLVGLLRFELGLMA